MVDKITTITNKEKFDVILQKCFMNNTSFVKSNNGNIEVKFLSCSDGDAVLKMPVVLTPPESSLAFTRYQKNIIFAYLKFNRAQESDTFVYNPVKLKIVNAERKDKRTNVESIKKKNLIYATNIISDYTIQKSLSKKVNSINRIEEIIKYNNEHDYEFIKVFFSNQDMNDNRMSFLRQKRKPLFIPHINFDKKDDDSITSFYLENVHKHDSFLNKRKDLVSEITVPLFYNKIPFGYVQVNDDMPFVKAKVSSVKRIASHIEKLGSDFSLFDEMDDKLLISNVSGKGIGIVFTDKKMVPIYKEKSMVALEIILPDSRRASMLAVVRHLDMLHNKIYKVGLKIRDMDKISTLNYEKYVESMSAN